MYSKVYCKELDSTRILLKRQYYRVMALEIHEEEEVGLGHHTLCEFIDVGARKWIHTERLRVIPIELGRTNPSFRIYYNEMIATSKILHSCEAFFCARSH